MSTGLKTLISVSTVFLLLLIVAYHMLEIQVFCFCKTAMQSISCAHLSGTVFCGCHFIGQQLRGQIDQIKINCIRKAFVYIVCIFCHINMIHGWEGGVAG